MLNFIISSNIVNAILYDFCRICLINKFPLEKRVVLKNTTRTKLRYEDIKTGKQRLGVIDESNVHYSMYIKKKDKIIEIENFLIENAKKNNFKIIEFDNLSIAVQDTINWIQHWYRK